MVIQVTADDVFKYGVKRTCRSCGINFYDRDQHPSECPNCGAIYELHVSTRAFKADSDKETIYDNVPFDIEEVEEEVVEQNVELVEDDPFDVLREDDA